MNLVLAHGGTAGAVAEAAFLAVPVVVFVILSRWSKRKAAALEAEGGIDGGTEGTGGRAGGRAGDDGGRGGNGGGADGEGAA